MCVHSLACRTSEFKLILVLKGGCIPLYLVKETFWDIYKKKILAFYLNIFVKKCKIEYQKKKKKKKKKEKSRLFFPSNVLGWLEKGQTNIFFLKA